MRSKPFATPLNRWNGSTKNEESFRTDLDLAGIRPSLLWISPMVGPTIVTRAAHVDSMIRFPIRAHYLTPLGRKPFRLSSRPVHIDPIAVISRSSRRADRSPDFQTWDKRACCIDERVAPEKNDLVIEKENASAFFGTHLAGYLIQHGVDTLLITGCSTSACIRATATDAKSFRFRPIVVRECVGDRSAAAHVWTLFDIQARFADVVPLDRVLEYLAELP